MGEASESGTGAHAKAIVRHRVRAARRALDAHRAEALCACLLLLMAANLCFATLRKSITNDEFVHIPAGYYHLVDGDFYMNSEHPPLVKTWAALPLLFVQPEEPPPAPGPSGQRYYTFWKTNEKRFHSLGFWPRVMMIPIMLALGVVIFLYTRRLFGPRAALFAVALFSFEPTFLAHGRVVHTDAPAALAYLLSFFALDAYARAPGRKTACLLGLACGVALVTKFSMMLVPALLASAALATVALGPRAGWPRGRTLRHAALVLLVAWFVIQIAYRFDSPPVETFDVKWIEWYAGSSSEKVLAGMRALSNIVPTYFLHGVYAVFAHNQDGHPASLLGMYGAKGWWYYFPVAFALKTTLPFLLLSVTSLAWSLWRLILRREKKFLALVVPLVAYAVVSMTSTINIGVRHFLPVFPFLFITGGALLDRLLISKRIPRAASVAMVAGFLGWAGFEAARAYPDYTPYMNQLASAHPHWWYLSDSNVEWGDDLGALADYLHERGETSVCGAYIGAGLSEYHGLRHCSLFAPPGTPLPVGVRYVALGAGYLNGSTVYEGDAGSGRATFNERVHFFAHFRARRPEAVIGNSIYVYRVDE